MSMQCLESQHILNIIIMTSLTGNATNLNKAKQLTLTALLAMSLQLTYHCGFSSGSIMSFERLKNKNIIQ